MIHLLRCFFLISALFVIEAHVAKSSENTLQMFRVTKPAKVFLRRNHRLQIGSLNPGVMLMKGWAPKNKKVPKNLIITNLGFIENTNLSIIQEKFEAVEYSTPPSGCEIDLVTSKLTCENIPEETPAPKTLDLSQMKIFTVLIEDCEVQGHEKVTAGSTLKDLNNSLIGPANTDLYFFRPVNQKNPVQAYLSIKPYCF